MMKFVGGLIAGGLLVAFGVSLGKSAGSDRRRFKRRHRTFIRRGNRLNPQTRRLEYEMRLYLREARELMAEMRNPKVPYSNIDAEFSVPGTANANSGAEPSSPEATEK